MNQHRYLRAYMAGIVVPTIFLLVIATAFCIFRYVYNLPVPIERIIVFPMAVVPNLWGLWNVLFAALRPGSRLSLGLHGALLPLLLAPLGLFLARVLDLPIHILGTRLPLMAAPLGLIAYYLVWKYLVGSLNRIVSLD